MAQPKEQIESWLRKSIARAVPAFWQNPNRLLVAASCAGSNRSGHGRSHEKVGGGLAVQGPHKERNRNFRHLIVIAQRLGGILSLC
jgi:hypothetical protein